MIAAVVEQRGRSREGCGSLCLISNTTTGSFYMLPCSISPSVPSTSRAVFCGGCRLWEMVARGDLCWRVKSRVHVEVRLAKVAANAMLSMSKV